MRRCEKCGTDHDGYPSGSLGTETRCLRAQAAGIGADHLVDQVDALARNVAERRDQTIARFVVPLDYCEDGSRPDQCDASSTGGRCDVCGVEMDRGSKSHD